MEAVTTKSTVCMAGMSVGAGTCNAWNGFVCCLKDAFSDCSMDAEIDTIIKTMEPGFGDIAGCQEATCSGGTSMGGSGGSPLPSPVETGLTAVIEMADPTLFNLETYIEAVKGKTGSSAVAAVLQVWEVALQYSVPDGISEATFKAALAKALSVAEDIINVVIAIGGRRLGEKRRLATNADITITAADATTAKALMTDSSNTTKLGNLGNELGGTIAVTKAAKAKAEIETTVSTEPSKVNALTAQLQSAGADVGGTITATVGTSTDTSLEASSSSSSRLSFLFAPLLILLTNLMQ